MSFVSIAYMISCCLLLPWLFWRPTSRIASRILQAINIWLPLYSIFLIQQSMWFYQLFLLMPLSSGTSDFKWYEVLDFYFFTPIVLMFLPFLFLWKRWRNHRVLTIFLLLLLLIHHPVSNWDLFNWHIQAAEWVSMLFISFSIFWLSQSFADQTRENVQ